MLGGVVTMGVLVEASATAKIVWLTWAGAGLVVLIWRGALSASAASERESS